jgi:hypothetical protein
MQEPTKKRAKRNSAATTANITGFKTGASASGKDKGELSASSQRRKYVCVRVSVVCVQWCQDYTHICIHHTAPLLRAPADEPYTCSKEGCTATFSYAYTRDRHIKGKNVPRVDYVSVVCVLHT